MNSEAEGYSATCSPETLKATDHARLTTMALGLLGRKVGMTQVFGEAGESIPVTVIQAGPCHVLQIRTKERDGYEAVQVGFLDKTRRVVSRSERGHVK